MIGMQDGTNHGPTLPAAEADDGPGNDASEPNDSTPEPANAAGASPSASASSALSPSPLATGISAALEKWRSVVDGFAGRRPAPAGPPTREAVIAGRLDAVSRIAGQLTESSDVAGVLRAIAEEACSALDADTASIRLLRAGRLEAIAWAGMTDDRAARLPAMGSDEPWFRTLVAEGSPRAVNDSRAAGRQGYERHVGEFTIGGDLAAPLLHDGRPVGFLRVVTRRPRRWTPDDVALVGALAHEASLATRVHELLERSERHAGQLAIAQAAAARLARARTVEAIGRAVLEEAGRAVDYDAGHVHVLEAADELVPVAAESRRPGQRPPDTETLRTHVGSGFAGWVAEHGEPLLVHDATADPRGTPTPGSADVHESLLVVPLRTEHGTEGVVTLSALGLRRFDEDDLRLLTILAGQAGTALESARIRARLDASTAELQPVIDLTADLTRRAEPRDVAGVLADHLARAAEVDACTVASWERPGGRMVRLGAYPAGAAVESDASMDVAAHPAALRALENRAPITVDAADPTASEADRALLRRHGLRARLLTLLPLVARGEAVGLVELVSSAGVELDDERLTLARAMADAGALALDGARLDVEARSQRDRDPLTGFHNHRQLHERLGEEIVRAQRTRRPLAVVMVDVDDFGLVNDTFGHFAGDRLLAWAADRLRTVLRSTDIAARYGGDEFAIVLPETDAEAAEAIAQRIAAAVEAQPFTDGRRGSLPVGVSTGLAAHPADGRTGAELVAAATERLKAVRRRAGRGSRASEGAPAAG